MKVLGLTGGIGSGKSTVAALLEELGARVVDADQLAREAVAPGSPGLSAIRARFGDAVLGADGALDRRKMGRLVFEDASLRSALEAIVHPQVAALATERIEEARRAGAPLAVYDVPLLYENKLDRMLPEVAVVWASLPVRRARLEARDENLSEEEIEARIAAQIPLEEKVERASYVIDNDGGLEETRAQVERLFRRLTREESPKGAQP